MSLVTLMPDWLLQIAGYGVSAAALYAGIRADLARLHERVEAARHAAHAANRRLDDLMNRGAMR